MPRNKIFRYLVEDLPKDQPAEHLEMSLKMSGSDGWELVTVLPLDETTWRYIFKKQLGPVT